MATKYRIETDKIDFHMPHVPECLTDQRAASFVINQDKAYVWDQEKNIYISLDRLAALKDAIEHVGKDKDMTFVIERDGYHAQVELFYGAMGVYVLRKMEYSFYDPYDSDSDNSSDGLHSDKCNCKDCITRMTSYELEETARILIKDKDGFYDMICQLVTKYLLY